MILSADVGEGHAAAARALAQQIGRSDPAVEVTTIDGVRAMGRLMRMVVEDGYRTQLRFMPWSYSMVYWLLDHVLPVRWLARALLCLAGSQSLRRAIEEHDPDVVVSTYPAVTVVLSRLRRRGQISCPVMATITDMTGLFFWAQRDIDMHLVMYDASLSSVQRIAGEGSVRVVRPLISAEFLEPRDRAAARSAMALPSDSRVVLVSGGGWGVGDIEGAVAELSRIPQATVVCLAGRNDLLREKLTARFAADAQVRVLGFTDQMGELLAAADVLVHSTGGVTCLEAIARGCPVVSYGLPIGHAKINTRAMADHDLVLLANSTAELLEHVERSCVERRQDISVARSPSHDASDVVLRAERRVSPLPAWRMRAARAGSAMVLALSAGTWMMSTDEMNALAAVLLRIKPVLTVHTTRPDVAVIVRAPQSAIAVIEGRLAADGVQATFASNSMPSAATLAQLRAAGNAFMPEATRAGILPTRWVAIRNHLRREARAMGLGHHFFYLEPRTGLTLGQLVLDRTAGALPVIGSVTLDSTSPLPQRPLRPGDVVVLTLDSSVASLRSLDVFASELAAERLSGVPLSAIA